MIHKTRVGPLVFFSLVILTSLAQAGESHTCPVSGVNKDIEQKLLEQSQKIQTISETAQKQMGNVPAQIRQIIDQPQSEK